MGWGGGGYISNGYHPALDTLSPGYPTRQKGHGATKEPGTRDALPPAPGDRMTHISENITFPQLRLGPVISRFYFCCDRTSLTVYSTEVSVAAQIRAE